MVAYAFRSKAVIFPCRLVKLGDLNFEDAGMSAFGMVEALLHDLLAV